VTKDNIAERLETFDLNLTIFSLLIINGQVIPGTISKAVCNIIDNTGKTYMSYTLYGFLKIWKSWPYAESFFAEQRSPEAQFPDIRKIAKKIRQEGIETFALNTETFIKQRKEIIQMLSRTFSIEALPSVFSSQKDDFPKASIGVDIRQTLSNHFQYPEPNLDQKRPLSIKYDGSKVTIVYNRATERLSSVELRDLVSYSYFRFLLHGIFPDPFIFPAERFGISLFYRELDFARNQLVDILQKMGEKNITEQKSKFKLEPDCNIYGQLALKPWICLHYKK